MQISDLNKSLLSILTGGREDKNAGDKTVSEKFSELLQSVGMDEKNVESVRPAAVNECREQTSSMEIKERPDSDNRTSAPEDEHEVSEEKTSAPIKKEKSKKTREEPQDEAVAPDKDASPVSSDSKKKTPDTPVSDNVSVVVENENTLAVVGNIALSPAVPEIMSEAVVSADAGEFPPVMENAEIVAVTDNTIPSEIIPVAATNEYEAKAVVSTVATLLPADREITGEEDTAQSPAADIGAEERTAILSAAVDNIKVQEIQEEQTAEIVRQEEKIAGMLPEETAMEIKVSVKEDKVTGFEDKKIVVPLVEEPDLDVAATETDSFVNLQSENVPTADTVNTDIRADLDKTPALSAVNISSSERGAQVVSAGEKGEIYAVQALASTEAVRPSSNGEVKFLAGNNQADVRNDGLTREVAEQVKVNITRSAVKGVDKIEIQLKPADLGRLEIKMQIAKDGTLHAHIIASNVETLDILQKDLETLKEAFNNAGYQTEDGSFSFGYHGEEQNNNEREQLRTFIGEVISRDVAEEMAANDYIGVDGVNIRV